MIIESNPKDPKLFSIEQPPTNFILRTTAQISTSVIDEGLFLSEVDESWSGVDPCQAPGQMIVAALDKVDPVEVGLVVNLLQGLEDDLALGAVLVI